MQANTQARPQLKQGLVNTVTSPTATASTWAVEGGGNGMKNGSCEPGGDVPPTTGGCGPNAEALPATGGCKADPELPPSVECDMTSGDSFKC